jgi:hypothetical protein
MADRDPAGYWFNLSSLSDMRERAKAALSCPSALGVTIPRLVDDANGTVDYLYRAYPFRLVIIDIDGRIAYYSHDSVLDHDSETLDVTITQTLNSLAANQGKVPAQLIAVDRHDAVGAQPASFWLPTLEYFSGKTAAVAKSTPARVENARGEQVAVAKAMADELLRKRACMIRRFGAGEDSRRTRPVVLYFTGANIDAATADAATLRAFFQRYQQHADCYLIFSPTGTTPGLDTLAQRAKRVATLRERLHLKIPCLLDGLENDVAFAYHVNTPRLFVMAKSGQNWTIQYASPYAGGSMALAVPAAESTVDQLTVGAKGYDGRLGSQASRLPGHAK